LIVVSSKYQRGQRPVHCALSIDCGIGTAGVTMRNLHTNNFASISGITDEAGAQCDNCSFIRKLTLLI